MIQLAEIDVRALREMAKRIHEDIANTYDAFGKGGWINRADVATTGMGAVLLQAKIAGLNDALKHIEETDKALTGRAPKREARVNG